VSTTSPAVGRIAVEPAWDGVDRSAERSHAGDDDDDDDDAVPQRVADGDAVARAADDAGTSD